MVAPYTLIREPGPDIGTGIFIPVTNELEPPANPARFMGILWSRFLLVTSKLVNRPLLYRTKILALG